MICYAINVADIGRSFYSHRLESSFVRHVLKPRRWILDDRRWTICPFLTDESQICHTIFREFQGFFFLVSFLFVTQRHMNANYQRIITRHSNLSRNRGQKRINERLLYVCPRTMDAHLRLDFWQMRATFVTQSLGI